MAYGGDLQANTAVDLMVGPFLDSTDGDTEETGLTITQAEVRLSKNGGNIAQKNEATSLVHDELGNYLCKLDATDTNAEGILSLMIHESGSLSIKMDYTVLSQAAYISKYTAKDAGFMDINIKTIGRTDTQETEADNLESATANYSVTRGLTGTAVPAVAADGVGGLPISDAGGLDLDAISSELAKVPKSDSTVTWNATALASIEAEAVDALESFNLDTLAGVDTGVAADGDLSPHVVTGSVLAHIMAANKDVTTSYNASTDSLEAIKVHADTIKAETASIQTETTALDTLTKAAGDGDLAAVLLDTAEIGTAGAGLTNITINAASVTAVWAKAMVDLAQGAPSATASVLTAINYLYEAWRNKTTTTATLITLMKDDGSTALVKSTISDDSTTFTKDEFITGA